MKIRRNDPCPCGSGKKYKRCCQPGQRTNEYATGTYQVKEPAGYTERRLAIVAANDELEKYRRKYERLCKNPKKVLARSEKLFAEPPFAALRFSGTDLQQAFDAVGYPPASGLEDAFFALAQKAIAFIVSAKQRDVLARHLLYLLPDYVEQRRYLDAWIIQHNAILLNEPPEGGCASFLLCMFLHGMEEWEVRRDRQESELFQRIGLDRETIRKEGYEGCIERIQQMMKDPDITDEVTQFLDAHPELKALSEAQCQEASQTAQRLLQREDAQSLLLSFEEVEPWLSVFEQRMCALPGILDAMQTKSKPKKKHEDALMDCVYALGGEMASAIFTQERVNQLVNEIHKYRRSLSRNDKVGITGVNGALMEVQSTGAPGENHLLTILCSKSLLKAVNKIAAESTP